MRAVKGEAESGGIGSGSGSLSKSIFGSDELLARGIRALVVLRLCPPPFHPIDAGQVSLHPATTEIAQAMVRGLRLQRRRRRVRYIATRR